MPADNPYVCPRCGPEPNYVKFCPGDLRCAECGAEVHDTCCECDEPAACCDGEEVYCNVHSPEKPDAPHPYRKR